MIVTCSSPLDPMLSPISSAGSTSSYLTRGGIHGQEEVLRLLFEGGAFPPKAKHLFLGNFVDRGKQATLNTICLLLAYKVKYEDNFFLLRGNPSCALSPAVSTGSTMSAIAATASSRGRRPQPTASTAFPSLASSTRGSSAATGDCLPTPQSMEEIKRLARPTTYTTQALCEIVQSKTAKGRVQGLHEMTVDCPSHFGLTWSPTSPAGTTSSYPSRWWRTVSSLSTVTSW
ncbi:hypothetical protein HPB48_026860 [Haemaphysalis longicornis]|uniref:protein-serine/threonine phosphatase n=1 Tax=Haemaphysalis longicornis TaxID=44386 RepID=A0A9J6HAK8_HAELO|nr:hypothetical protein HPB48_026860 [Haemaphysalis longicornis]